MSDTEYRPTWENRRRVIFATLVFCAAIIAYCVWKDTGSKTHETALTMAFICATSIIGAYVFGATWDDANVIKGAR